MRNTSGLDQIVAALDKDSKRWGFGELVRNVRGSVDKRVSCLLSLYREEGTNRQPEKMAGCLEAEGMHSEMLERGQQRGGGQGKGTAGGRPGQRQVYPLCDQEGSWSPLSHTTQRARAIFALRGADGSLCCDALGMSPSPVGPGVFTG